MTLPLPHCCCRHSRPRPAAPAPAIPFLVVVASAVVVVALLLSPPPLLLSPLLLFLLPPPPLHFPPFVWPRTCLLVFARSALLVCATWSRLFGFRSWSFVLVCFRSCSFGVACARSAFCLLRSCSFGVACACSAFVALVQPFVCVCIKYVLVQTWWATYFISWNINLYKNYWLSLIHKSITYIVAEVGCEWEWEERVGWGLWLEAMMYHGWRQFGSVTVWHCVLIFCFPSICIYNKFYANILYF